jgi:hypothetical protein
MLSALDRRFAGPYSLIVPNGTMNSSEAKAGGEEVLESIETKGVLDADS